MALVSLAQAKNHLGAWTDDSNDDVALKAEQASAIVLDYLKSRANIVATIASSSVAVAAVIATAATHRFTTGDTAVIAGLEDSVPDLNGSHVVTVLTTTTFSVPVTTTVAGTGGTATVAWTDQTVPGHVQAATLLLLGHLYEQRGNDMKTDEALWTAIGRLLARSRDPALA